LEKNGSLSSEGKTRAKRYKLTKKVPGHLEEKNYIPLSASALSIQHQISQPMQVRRHVSYNRKLLDHYRPNTTYYLAEKERDRLLELGKTSGHHPAGTYAKQTFNRLLIDLSWNSSRLEGNTYSLLETERLFELGQAAEGKDQRETHPNDFKP